MFRLLFLLAYCILTAPIFSATLPEAKPEEVGMSTERLKRLSAAIQRYIDDGELAGTVTLIARRGRVVHFEAQGLLDIEKKIPMRKDAIFRLASMTKPITSVAVMMLFEEGHFLLDDPVSKFIPEFKNPQVAVVAPPGGANLAGRKLVPAEREITIRHLLTHTAGLVSDPVPSFLIRPEFDLKFEKEHTPNETICDYTRRLAKVPLHFQPGTVWEYGLATDALACLVEVVSGQTFDKFLFERLFKPLEMNETFFYVPEEKLSRLATIYEPAEPKGLRARVQVPSFAVPFYGQEGRGSRFFFAGVAGLSSTAEDYLKFSQMLLNGGSFNGARLLSRKTVELMTANHIGDKPIHFDWLSGYRFGLGFRVLTEIGRSWGISSPGEYGWSGAFTTWFWIDPKEEMVGIFMTQKAPTDRNARFQVQTLAMQAIVD